MKSQSNDITKLNIMEKTKMKIYLKGCRSCDNRVQIHTISKKTELGFLLKCHKCKVTDPHNHTKTFLKNREVDLKEFK